MSLSTIDQMKKAAADYENFYAEDYSVPERALFWAQISQALAAERQAAALERIAAVLEFWQEWRPTLAITGDARKALDEQIP